MIAQRKHNRVTMQAKDSKIERERERDLKGENYTTLGATTIAHLVEVRLCNNVIYRYACDLNWRISGIIFSMINLSSN